MNKTTKKGEEGIILSRGTFRDLASHAMCERMKHIVDCSDDPFLNTIFTLEFSMLLGDIEIAVFGKEKDNG